VPANISTALGFDFGTRKIGVAVGQTLTRCASPVETLRQVRQQPDWQGISRLIREWQPQALIVGLPLNMDDTETEVAGMARRFSRQLHGRYGLPVFLVDERLTSKAAAELAGGERAKIDALAAKLILETWLREHF
jgi:putative Holliday junction resolvase